MPYFPPTGRVFDTGLFNNLFKPIIGIEPYAYMEWFVAKDSGAANVITEHVSKTYDLAFHSNHKSMISWKPLFTRCSAMILAIPFAIVAF